MYYNFSQLKAIALQVNDYLFSGGQDIQKVKDARRVYDIYKAYDEKDRNVISDLLTRRLRKHYLKSSKDKLDNIAHEAHNKATKQYWNALFGAAKRDETDPRPDGSKRVDSVAKAFKNRTLKIADARNGK